MKKTIFYVLLAFIGAVSGSALLTSCSNEVDLDSSNLEKLEDKVWKFDNGLELSSGEKFDFEDNSFAYKFVKMDEFTYRLYESIVR